MTSEYQIGCPECYMSCGLNAILSKSENEFRCTANPTHKFKMGTDGFLKTL